MEHDSAPAVNSPEASCVCAVLVTYHPNDTFPERLARITGQVGGVIIIDNGSSPDEVRMLRDACDGSTCRLVQNGENLGIAGALNIGLRLVDSEGYPWALTLDQDSQIAGDMVRRLCQVYSGYERKERLAIVAANYTYAGSDIPGYAPPEMRAMPGSDWGEPLTAITSGSLHSMEAYRAIGPFRDELFIDFVDIEYCFRARAAGWQIVATTDPLMIHEVGDLTPHRFLGRRVWTFNYAPQRWYYRTRNHVAVMRAVLFRQPAWCFRSGWAVFKSWIKVGLFEDNAAAKLANVARGILHGLTLKYAPVPAGDGARRAAKRI